MTFLLRSLAVALALLPIAGDAEIVEDARGFSFDVPPTLSALPELMPGVRTWGRGAIAQPSFRRLTVSGFGGRLPQQPANHAIVEESARVAAGQSGLTIDSFAYRTVTWRDLEIELLIERTHIADSEVVAVNGALPFVPEAMLIGLMGPASEAGAIDAEFDAILATFEGKSSWKTATQRRDRARGEAAGALCGLLLLLAFPVAAWRLFRK